MKVDPASEETKMMNQMRGRILHFLQLSNCAFRIEGRTVQTAAATLHFDEDALRIERPDKPIRAMHYQRLNLDKLLMIINAEAAVGSRLHQS